jgi:lactoylglutathione lyase
MPAMQISQLDHVALHVADVDRSVAFYRDVLQLQPIPRPAFSFPGAWFRLGTHQELHLIGERQQAVVSHNRGNHYALLVDDLDAWEQHLAACGAQFLPRKLRPDGAEQVFVVDPDGHYVELCTPQPQA